MDSVFIHIFNMSVTASWLIFAICLIRLLIKKAPKSIAVWLWSLVGLRLMLPFSFESILSLLPSSQTIPPDIIYASEPKIHSGVTILNSSINPIISEALSPDTTYSANPAQVILFVLFIIWIIGMAGMAVYTLGSFIRMRLRVSSAILLYDNIYLCDGIESPFILGIIKPKIYLPSDISDADSELVIAHEKAHISRLDYIWKPFAFLLVSVYWFNPVIWIGYILFCRDIEFATDEKVIKNLDCKKEYSKALLNLSSPRHFISACPLAFGENSVKARIKSVLSYKKPAVWIIVLAILCCVFVAVCFLTDPPSDKTESDAERALIVTDVGTTNGAVEIEYVSGSLYDEFPYIEFRWENKSNVNLEYGEVFKLYKDGKEVKSDTVWNLPLHIVGAGRGEYDSCSLVGFDISQNGKYQLEKEFTLSGYNEKHKAYIEFEIDRAYSFSGHQLKSENMVYDNGSFSSVFYSDTSSPILRISDDDMHLLTSEHPNSPVLSSYFYDAGPLKKFKLSESNFDALTTSQIWDEGYSAKAIRENNKYAFRVEDKDADRLYYILEQNNGDIYFCYGSCNKNVFIRWIFKMTNANVEYKYSRYSYLSSSEAIPPYISLNETDKIFTFMYSPLSSYLPYGKYELKENTLILSTDDGKFTYYFEKQGNSYIFDAKRSSYIATIPDGAVFE